MSISPIPYKAGQVTFEELQRMTPSQVAFLIADGANEKLAEQIIATSGKEPIRICSTLWFVNPLIAKQVCQKSKQTQIQRDINADAVPLPARLQIVSMLTAALDMVQQYPVDDYNVFVPREWLMLPQDATIQIIADTREHFGQVSGLGSSRLHGELSAYTIGFPRRHADPALVIIVLPEAFQHGVIHLAAILAHELYGHAYLELTAKSSFIRKNSNEAFAFLIGAYYLMGLAAGIMSSRAQSMEPDLQKEISSAFAMELRGMMQQIQSPNFSAKELFGLIF